MIEQYAIPEQLAFGDHPALAGIKMAEKGVAFGNIEQETRESGSHLMDIMFVLNTKAKIRGEESLIYLINNYPME